MPAQLTRPRPGRPASLGMSAVGALAPVRAKWPIRVLALLGAGAIAVGLFVLADRPALAVGIGVAIAAIVAAVIVFDVRSTQRGRLLDTAIEAVSPILGARAPSREIFRAAGWTGGWVGMPRKIRMRYSATVDDVDPRFIDGVLEQLERRLGAKYRTTRHLPRKCLLVVELDIRATMTASPEVLRAEKVAKELLGATAKVSCSVDGESGAVLAIDVRHDMGPRLALSTYRQRIEKVLSSMLPGRWRAHWDLEHDEVRFEIRPTMPSMIAHEVGEPRPELTHSSYQACKIAYCVDEDGNTQYWQPSVSPHMLIIGGTGSGKTSAEHTLLTDLSLYGWRVWVLDGKRIEFAGYKDWPNVELVASKIGDQVRMLHAAHDLMEERYSLIESGEASVADFDPLALIIDEYATFKSRVTRWYKTVKPKGAPTQPPVFDLLPDLARLARSAKIHMVLGIQRPDAEFLGGEMRDNFGARLSLGRLSPQGANMMWDSFAVGVAIPRNQRGRGVALNEYSNPVDVQTFYTPDPARLTEEDQAQWKILEPLRPPVIKYPRQMIIEPSFSDAGEGDDDPMYGDWATARIIPFNRDLAAASIDVDRARPTGGVRFEPLDETEEPLDLPAEVSSDAGLFEGYGDIDSSRISDVSIGDLVMVDEGLLIWGVVEAVEPDVFAEGYMSVDYRDLESGEPNTMSLPEADALTVRRPES